MLTCRGNLQPWTRRTRRLHFVLHMSPPPPPHDESCDVIARRVAAHQSWRLFFFFCCNTKRRELWVTALRVPPPLSLLNSLPLELHKPQMPHRVGRISPRFSARRKKKTLSVGLRARAPTLPPAAGGRRTWRRDSAARRGQGGGGGASVSLLRPWNHTTSWAPCTSCTSNRWALFYFVWEKKNFHYLKRMFIHRHSDLLFIRVWLLFTI